MALCSDFRPSAEPIHGLSLCAGYGGIDLGLNIAEPQYHTVCFVEREAHAAATLVARMADQALADALVWDDLKSFDGRAWRGRVDIITAGYPCQPFSLCGKRGGSSDPRHLWPDVARIVAETEPEWVFAENVEGHITLGCAEIAADLRALGYAVKAGMFAAAEAGASHRRRRLFILAHANRERCRLLPRLADFRSGIAGAPACDATSRQRRAVSVVQCSASMDDAVAADDGAWMPDLRGPGGIFSPDPDQLQLWSEVLDREPRLQPAVFRESDGLAERVERNRGIGNGVCPMVAAIAWAVLKADFQRDMGR